MFKSKQTDRKEPLKESSLCLSLSSVTHREVSAGFDHWRSFQGIKSLSNFSQRLKYKSFLSHHSVLVLAVPKNVVQFHWWHLFDVVWSVWGIFLWGDFIFWAAGKTPGCRLSSHEAALPIGFPSRISRDHPAITFPWLKFSGNSLLLP